MPDLFIDGTWRSASAGARRDDRRVPVGPGRQGRGRRRLPDGGPEVRRGAVDPLGQEHIVGTGEARIPDAVEVLRRHREQGERLLRHVRPGGHRVE